VGENCKKQANRRKFPALIIAFRISVAHSDNRFYDSGDVLVRCEHDKTAPAVIRPA